jgi:hypothetical protein
MNNLTTETIVTAVWTTSDTLDKWEQSHTFSHDNVASAIRTTKARITRWFGPHEIISITINHKGA